jgi:diphosphomevalonate decarboxylase
MAKITVSAPANIAFIKYWGARDLERAIPFNASISMTLSACSSRTTVEFVPGDRHTELWIAQEDGTLEPAPPAFAGRMEAHLKRLQAWAGRDGSFRVATRNSFPAAAGMASSASGFAALTLAAAGALEVELSPRQRSALARWSGSGSAARSVFGGYVEWPADDLNGDGLDAKNPDEDEACSARVLASWDHWDLADIIALVETGPKDVSSLDGHRRAGTSPHFAERLRQLPRRLEAVRQAIQSRDLEALGEVVEEDSTELHLIAMSSRPPIFYWRPASLTVLEEVRQLRRDGLGAYATLDAGANVHVICRAADSETVARRLEALPGVEGVLRDRVGPGPETLAEGWF